MSRIPYLDRLGDAFEDAITSPQRRRQPRGVTVLAVSFVVVLLGGAVLWLLRDGRDPGVAEPPATSQPIPEPTANAPATPDTWARVPSQPALEGEGRFTLSAVTATPSGFAAAGTLVAPEPVGEAGDFPVAGVVVASDDGIGWDTLVRVDGVSLSDVAYGAGGLVAVGSRDLGPVVVGAAGDVGELPVAPGPSDRVALAHGIAATRDRLVVVGSELAIDSETQEQQQRPAIWWSNDGVSWNAIESPSFAWSHEASINDVIATDTFVVAAGLVGEEPGVTSATAWVSFDGEDWEIIEMPTPPPGGGFTGVSGLAHGHDIFVAVGFTHSSSGRVAAVWVSPDGRNWEVVASEEAFRGSDANASTQMAAVTATADGFVAVGHTLERPTLRQLIWTGDGSGTLWRRLDLEDRGGDAVMATASSVVAGVDSLVIVGHDSDLTFAKGSGAVWVGPAPAELVAAVPITAAPVEADDVVTVSAVPDRAVPATSLLIRGRVPDGVELDEIPVWLVSGNGDVIELCRAIPQGRNFMCRTTVGDLESQPDPGTYSIAVLDPTAVVEGAAIEVLAAGTPILTLSGVYNSSLWPLLLTVSVQNRGGAEIDLSGWALVNEGRDEPRFDFPEGTVVAPGSSVLLDFSGPGGGFCPEDADSYFHWCNLVSDSGRIDFGENEMLWRGGALHLVNDAGEVVAEWSRP